MKIERLISMIMILLQRELVSATELAKTFEVTTRTIYRDVETLNMAKIPIFTVTGRNGGIGLMPTYKVDKKLLTSKDLQNILTALHGVEQLIQSPEIKSTMTKIRAMQTEQWNAEMDFSLHFTGWQGTEELKAVAESLQDAIRLHVIVKFDYYDANGTHSSRTIEPYHLMYKGERWYIQGYSFEREDFRTFRLARMTNLKFTNETFNPRDYAVIDKIPKENLPQFYPVRLKANMRVRDIIIERFGTSVITPCDETTYFADLQLPNVENAYRFILQLGANAEVLAGGIFEKDFRVYLAKIINIYEPATPPNLEVNKKNLY
ncbi:YafY family transcriptional regulator [Neobacillus sp. MM2021_6]|uniref:helix-turn-helix transcriptional regulator n=1 Tax=Bacillaceae TaxID=186817 RepID=UPI00140B6348|nr:MULTISPECIES: YafY family protein [Bacillaceae]MBO0959672.1 YafY family transcriptional regulator [Neobacillus sp. MM2021_6]NHC19782.1 YafY family transcriptional regulator [Bacillus sp. MM2020_4]